MRLVDYPTIIKKAWAGFDASVRIDTIEDISARVSTNHVFKVTFDDGDTIIAKLSYFGKYEHFLEDHRIIHVLANNLLYPFENVLAKSLVRDGQVYTTGIRMVLSMLGLCFITRSESSTNCPAG
jgi:hypothetical protein